MKKIIICSLAVLLISGCSKTPEEKISNLYQDGITQIRDFKFDLADSTFNQIFEINPASVPGLIGIAKIAEARLQYYDAINYYNMILATSTDYEEAFIGLYNSYKNLGFYNEALESAVYYNNLWKSNLHSTYLVGEAYKNLGEVQRAETYFKQLTTSDYEHAHTAQLMVATVMVKQGKLDDATKIVSKVLSEKVDNALFYNAAAEYFETVGMIDSSMYYNRKLFAYNKRNINTVYLSFKRALKNNYLYDARKIISTLKNLKIEPLVLEGFNLFYALHIDDKSLIRTYGQNYRSYAPNSLTAAMYEVKSRAEISDKLSMGQDLNVLEGKMSRGEMNNDFGDFYHYAMLMLNIKYEKNPTTIQQLENIQGIRVNRKEYKLELALTNHIIGFFDKCYKSLEVIESAHQRNASWLTAIAEVWSNPAIRKYSKAEELYAKALKQDPNYIQAFDSQLKLYDRTKDYKKALELFSKQPQFEKNYVRALLKTKYLFLNKNYNEGLSQFKKYYAFVSGDIVFVSELVKILHSLNRSDEVNAILTFIDKNNQDAKILLARNALDNKEYAKSLEFLDNAIATEPENPTAHILVARTKYYMGEKTEAYDLFEKNLVKFNRNPRNLLYYSQILSLEGINFDKASNLARQAAFEGYATYEYVMNLADIYYRMGRYDLCRGESIKAIGVNRENPYPYFRYGMTCSKSADQDKWGKKVTEFLRKSKELGLSGEFLIEANKTLKKY